MKKIICFALVLCMLLAAGVLASCSDEPQESSAVTEESKDDAPKALVPHLGKTDKHNGKVLRILTSAKDNAFGYQTFGAEINDENEPVNEACLARNALIEQEYGFTVEAEFIDGFDPFKERVINDTISGTISYDVVCTGIQTIAQLSTEGIFLDLLTIPDSNLHLNEKWWDVESNEDMTIGGRLFFTTGDIHYLDDENTRCVFYNRKIASENNLNPSQMVYDGTWTIDEMYEMMKVVAADRDDGTMNVSGDDVWGCVSDAFDLYTLVLGCDCPQVEKDENDYPVMAMMNEKNVRAWEKAVKMVTDKERYAYTEAFFRWDSPDAHIVKDQFTEGKSLFLVSLIKTVNSDKMRNANFSYGILPLPKYDVEQEKYATTVNPYYFFVLSIMNSCKDTDFVTFALETLAYTNSEMVTKEYYDRTLKNKRFLDDNDSPEMLDIIFSNRLVDISVAFNWDDCIQYYNRTLSNPTGDITSSLEARMSSFETAKQETIDFFETLK